MLEAMLNDDDQFCPSVHTSVSQSVRQFVSHSSISLIVTCCLSKGPRGDPTGPAGLTHALSARPSGPSPLSCIKTGLTGRTFPALSLLTKPDNIASTILP